MKPDWIPAAAGECPLTHAVQVWRLQLPLDPQAADQLAAYLTAEENDRAGRFRRDVDRERFVAGRGALRVLLAAWLGATPGDVRFAQSPHGKPLLAGGTAPKVDFNVAHSGQVVLIALGFGADVGVDVEAVRPLPDARALAERFFAPAETAALAALPEAEQPAVFLCLWTRKEALLKAVGTGIGGGLDAFEVTSGAEAAVRRVAGDAQAAADWTLCEFQPAPEHLGCVAVRRPAARFVFYEFRLKHFS